MSDAIETFRAQTGATDANIIDLQTFLGMLTDIVAYTLDLDLETKMGLLAERNVVERTKMLLAALSARPAGAGGRPFPPEFSRN